MKLYIKLVGALAFTGVWLGVLIPSLISADSDALVFLGFAALAAYPVVLWSMFKTEIVTLKDKINENL